ncbi:MAG: hypothetical protein ABIS38_01525 [Sphingomicrobium sp.]
MKLRMPAALVTTESEYAAHLTGMNTFFGAVLGFVMAGTERLDQFEFGFVLVLVSGIIISILYVTASAHKVIYALLTLVMILSMPWLVVPILDQGEKLPDKLQATLLVWTIITVAIEFMPRRPDDPPQDAA